MIKEIIRLRHSCGLSQVQISKALGCARSSLQDCLYRAQAVGLSWPLPGELDDEQLEALLYKKKPSAVQSNRPKPDCQYMHLELKKKGVTLVQLWNEYRRSIQMDMG
jgi:transposase